MSKISAILRKHADKRPRLVAEPMEETALGLKQVRDSDGCLVWQTTPEFEAFVDVEYENHLCQDRDILMQWFLAKLPGKSLTLDIQTTAAAKTVDVTLVMKDLQREMWYSTSDCREVYTASEQSRIAEMIAAQKDRLMPMWANVLALDNPCAADLACFKPRQKSRRRRLLVKL